MFKNLSFLTPEHMENCLLEDFHLNLQIDAQFTDFIYNTYTTDKTFLQLCGGLWAEHIRTTKTCEEFQNKLSRMYYDVYFHVFNSVDVVLEIQNVTYFRMKTKPNRSVQLKQKIKEQMKKTDESYINY